MEDGVWLKSICSKNHLSVSDEQVDLLQEYVRLLLEWNKKINLISRKDEDHIWTRHVLASIALLFRFEFYPESSIVDVGTGGGLPGIPLAILNKDLDVTLIDSIQKKIRAVSEILSTLNIGTIKIGCGRIEDLNGVQPFHRSFDYVIARGVATITDMLNWGIPLVRHSQRDSSREPDSPRKQLVRGSIILLKGGDLTSEVEQALQKHKPQEIKIYPVIIDGIDPLELVDKKIVIIHP